jgi:hypothetical protein
MSILKKPVKFAQSLLKQLLKLSKGMVKAVVNSVLRILLKIGKRSNLARAGFVLPTIMMVVLVVTLAATTLVLRSLDRNRNAILPAQSKSSRIMQLRQLTEPMPNWQNFW